VRTDYLLADADGHYYEPDDCFSRHLSSKERDFAVRVVRSSADDVGAVMIGDDRLTVFPTHLSDATFTPGSARGAVYGDERVSRPRSDVIRSTDVPESVDREARLKALDSWGIEVNVIYPTLALTVWPELVLRGPDALYANLRSFNTWIEEEWGYGGDGRTFAAPMVVLVEPERAVAELERLLARGVRVLALVPASPRMGVLPGDRRFDGFWARVNEAGVPVGVHGCVVAYGDTYSPARVFTQLNALTPMQRLFEVDRQVMDTLGSLVLDDVFGRFPGVRAMSVELGSRWVEYLLGAMDRSANQTGGWWRDGRTELPSDVFRRHVWVEPFETDDLTRLAELIGVDRILFGSDFPHPEGLENPLQFLDAIASFTPADQRLILRDNLLNLLSPA